MRSALRRCPDLSRKRDGIVVTADPNRISDAQMDIWRKSAKRKLLPAGVGNVAQDWAKGLNPSECSNVGLFFALDYEIFLWYIFFEIT